MKRRCCQTKGWRHGGEGDAYDGQRVSRGSIREERLREGCSRAYKRDWVGVSTHLRGRVEGRARKARGEKEERCRMA